MFGGIRVASIRRQDRLIRSLWGQRLKQNHPDPVFCDHQIKHRSYLRMLESWERTVGRDNLVVSILTKGSPLPQDLQARALSSAAHPSVVSSCLGGQLETPHVRISCSTPQLYGES